MELNEDIAELIGIILGDGCLTIYKHNKGSDYKICIAGGHEEEKYFFYIQKQISKFIPQKSCILHQKDGLVLIVRSKYGFILFQELGIPIGKKGNLFGIPSKVLQNKNIACALLRGLADTDFSVCFKKGGRKTNSYPRIYGSSISKNLMIGVTQILDFLGIKYYFYSRLRDTNFSKNHRIYCLDINGRKNFELWMEHIGFSNEKHLSKIRVWKKLGYCPPNTSYKERLKILEQ